jgi:adenylate cyclase
MIRSLATYIPPDRQRALASGSDLPEQTSGAALLADISGFSHLTESLRQLWGDRRGAEELSRQLNQVYDSLLAETDRYGGSVISFAGDGLVCWFDEVDNWPGNSAAGRAVTCALAMQTALAGQTAVSLPNASPIKLSMTCNVTSGAAYRLLVGDPSQQLLDTLVGAPLNRLEPAKRLTRGGELLVDEETAVALAGQIHLAEWRQSDQNQRKFGRVTACRPEAAPQPWPPLDPSALTLGQLRAWLLTAVYEREWTGSGEFLTELRPAVALFLRFTGLGYESEAQAADQLNAFISRAQNRLAEYGGTLLQLNIGDKGSYLYAAFGAPIAHGDDSQRAAAATLALHPLAAEFALPPLQIGLSRGVMRAGAYGGQSRRTYGVLGDNVNLAARLMEWAAPGQTLADERIHTRLRGAFHFVPLPSLSLPEATAVFALVGRRAQPVAHFQESASAQPLIGRAAEQALLAEKIALARQGQGQIVGLSAEVGMGKSRLLAETLRQAAEWGLRVYSGASPAYGGNIPYMVWQPIWQAFFGLDLAAPLGEQVEALETAVVALAPQRLDAVPLLAAALGLPAPDTPFTQALDPQSRKSALEALWLDCLRAAAGQAQAEGAALLLALDDLQWIDPVSRDLLELVGRASADWATLLLLAYRPSDDPRLQAPRLEQMAHFTPMPLREFSPAEVKELIRQKTAVGGQFLPLRDNPQIIPSIIERSQGNPFYVEELINYLRESGRQPASAGELPTSLHSLILSRIDRLDERKKVILKVASVIGRTFLFSWLAGYYPALGPTTELQRQMGELTRLDLIPIDRPEPELTYMFKHVITQEAAYESLPYATRAALHEQLAVYLEQLGAEQRLDLLAYHYERSENLARKRLYLRRAGSAAAARFANAEAVGYFSRALALVPAEDVAAQYDLRAQRERLYDLLGDRPAQQADLDALVALARELGDRGKQIEVMLRQSRCAEVMGDYPASAAVAETAVIWAQGMGDVALAAAAYLQRGRVGVRQGEYEAAADHSRRALALAEQVDDRSLQASCVRNLGTVAWALGDYAEARRQYERAAALNRAAGNRRDESIMFNNLGVVALTQSAYEQANAYYTAARELLRQIGDRHTEAVVLGNLGLVAMFQGNYDLAVSYQEQSLQLRQEIADSFGEHLALLNLGALRLYEGDYPQAERLLQMAWRYFREAGDAQEAAGALIYLGLLRCWQGEFAEGQAFSQQALDLARQRGLRSEEAMALNHLGHALLGLADWAGATAVYRQSLHLFREIGQCNYAQEARAGLVAVALRQGDLAGALAEVEAILEYLAASSLDGTYDPMRVYLVCYEALRAAGDGRWRTVLSEAADLLRARAEAIREEWGRTGYLTAVPANQQLQAALRREFG